MLKAIFLPEFKRSLIMKVLIAMGVLAVLSIGEYMVGAFGFQKTTITALGGTPDLIVNSMLWVLIILSGFFSGAGAFLKINERHIPFVHSLPMSRRTVWEAIAGAHTLTSLLVIPLVLVARPSLWRELTSGSLAGSTIYGIGAYVALFAAGFCFVMLCRSQIGRAHV